MELEAVMRALAKSSSDHGFVAEANKEAYEARVLAAEREIETLGVILGQERKNGEGLRAQIVTLQQQVDRLLGLLHEQQEQMKVQQEIQGG